ncbi:ATP-grasp domain-containing protein [Streptomyces sp. NA04227]|uniref:ATP-binding protein n=1 Tax=Streptomyces sp. NA04227 TaxID=2742136 RepID=UPI00158FAA02|nr:biotin carboxylase N-terminal domain-containing protein [Streptomyces sp. NA04227]QKW10836.1 ATP-grasp domain-containing protein [Streptomyces sp. NA04227]
MRPTAARPAEVREIGSVLVANRGEIACRIFRTCRELGIATVAVHSDADERALHTRQAESAVRLPGNTPAETYLRGELLVKAAQAAGADAVHPGYGFLSENAEFARAVQGAGLLWIGPPPEAIESMASKTRAKELMAAAGVPLLAPLDPAAVTEADLPVLVKAAAGGGGRGMRVVRQLADLPQELEAARAEAASAFGDGEVFVEPYLERGRHVEVQVLADAHGTVWALGTRDCSLQRRHQKVIEEAPAPGLSRALREELHAAAVAAARAIGYTGAGTVEFLVRGEQAYFLEMNTRLQVEHPVTEAVFGLDLVALQLRIAEGGALDTEPPAPRGHAVEARLYAEDPAQGWLPQTGTLHRFELGTTPNSVRLDAGYASGDTVGVHYDAMLAKVIAWAPTRAEAVRTLAGTLRRAVLHGPVTNRDLLVRSLRHPEFTGTPDAGAPGGLLLTGLDTGFYERHATELTDSAGELEERAVAVAALAAALADSAERTASAPAANDAGRPGGVQPGTRTFGGWRNLPSQSQSRRYAGPGGEIEVRYRALREGLEPVDLPGVRVSEAAPGSVVLEVDGVRRRFTVGRYGSRVHVDTAEGAYTLTALPRFPDPSEQRAPGSLLAPMPGTVIRLAEGLAVGDRVEAGDPLVWLEAMKMEHRIAAPASGTLTALPAAVGHQVEVGAVLAVVSSDATAQDDTAQDA